MPALGTYRKIFKEKFGNSSTRRYFYRVTTKNSRDPHENYIASRSSKKNEKSDSEVEIAGLGAADDFQKSTHYTRSLDGNRNAEPEFVDFDTVNVDGSVRVPSRY